MKVNILGTSRKGKKDFLLTASADKSFTMLCLHKDGVDHFEQLSVIDWQFGGEKVKLTFKDGKSQYVDFDAKYQEVKIKERAFVGEASKTTTLGSLEVGDKFIFGGVQFTVAHFERDEENDYQLGCTILDTNATVYIMNHALIELI